MLAEDVCGRRCADGQREEAPAPRLRLRCVAPQVRLALPVGVASHHLTALLPAILNPELVLPAGGIPGAVVPDVRAIQVAGARLVRVVGLERLALPVDAPLQPVDAVLVVVAWHAVLVPESADPILHLRQRLLAPPQLQTLVLRVVHHGTVDAIAAIARRVAELVGLAEHLSAVRPTSVGRGSDARGERRVRSGLPAALPAIELA
mmetsp:Transcript_132887/g.384216  ORF Transcript_132887/g.384216 Transcript_132887/m.384216 type:complete len:205 (+) Transcript_132887:481-1095(+)